MNNPLNLFSVPTGVTPGGIGLAILEFSTVILFAIGGIFYYLLVRKEGTTKRQIFALVGVISCFIGGLPNAIDKLSWAIAEKDLWFDSSWMFLFVGIGYCLLFVSALDGFVKGKSPSNNGENSSSDNKNVNLKGSCVAVLLMFSSPALGKPIKYLGMLAAAVGMLGFYIVMFIRAKKVIGNKAYLYFITMGVTLFLVVFSAAAEFDVLWPNMLAQTFNNLGYIALILANKFYIKELDKQKEASETVTTEVEQPEQE